MLRELTVREILVVSLKLLTFKKNNKFKNSHAIQIHIAFCNDAPAHRDGSRYQETKST